MHENWKNAAKYKLESEPNIWQYIATFCYNQVNQNL